MYINTKLSQLHFLLRKNIINYRDINLISFFNQGIIYFIINIYSILRLKNMDLIFPYFLFLFYFILDLSFTFLFLEL